MEISIIIVEISIFLRLVDKKQYLVEK